MRRRLVCGLIAAFLAACFPIRSAEKSQHWLEVRSPHFTVLTDGTEEQARRVAHQFEQIRGIFQQSFPNVRVDFDQPTTILAARGEGSLKSLLPSFWTERWQSRLAGIAVDAEGAQYIRC